MEQSHKTNPIIQEWFVPLSNSPSPSHSVYCGIISQLCFRKHRRFVFRWRSVLQIPFLLHFPRAVVAAHDDKVISCSLFSFFREGIPVI